MNRRSSAPKIVLATASMLRHVFLCYRYAIEREVLEKILEGQELLEEKGPDLRRPHVGTLRKSKYKKLKGLVVQYKGRPIRIAFLFDENRHGIFLVGAYKDGPQDKMLYK